MSSKVLMALECLTQVLVSLFDKICRGDEELTETFRCLPDCLIVDIISRLPIDTLVRCRRNCRDLRALISSHYFTTLHLSRARPMLLFHNFWDTRKRHKQLYVLDNTGEITYLCRLPGLSWGTYSKTIVYSCQGVLLFASSMWPSTTYYVLNPITQEEVIIQHKHEPGRFCALYFCRELKLLYAQVRGSLCQYLVYIFKTQTWRKIRSSSSSSNTNFNFLPYNRAPAVVNGALHWITYSDLEKKGLPPNCANNGIIVFRMDKEQLSAKPHPGSVEQEHRTMTLLVKENCLSFCHLLGSEFSLDIWILEDYEKWAWNKRYKVNLFCEIIFPYNLPYVGKVPANMYLFIKIFYIQDGELILYSPGGRYIFFYNLDHKTVKGVSLPPEMDRLHAYEASGSYLKSMLPIA